MTESCGRERARGCAHILQEFGHLRARVVLAHLAVALVPLPEVEHVGFVQVLAHFKGYNATIFFLHSRLETTHMGVLTATLHTCLVSIQASEQACLQ